MVSSKGIPSKEARGESALSIICSYPTTRQDEFLRSQGFYLDNSIVIRDACLQVASSSPNEHIALGPERLHGAWLHLIEVNTALHNCTVVTLYQHTITLMQREFSGIFGRDQKTITPYARHRIFLRMDQTIKLV